MFHAELARRLALDLEHATQTGEVEWEACHSLFDRLMTELQQVKPELEHFVSTRTIV
jgi:hypothetical protein